jgi:hypothetical protein
MLDLNNNNLNNTVIDLFTLYKISTDENCLKFVLALIIILILFLLGYFIYLKIGLFFCILSLLISISWGIYKIYKIKKDIENSPSLKLMRIKKENK